jgi:hypothetical protein
MGFGIDLMSEKCQIVQITKGNFMKILSVLVLVLSSQAFAIVPMKCVVRDSGQMPDEVATLYTDANGRIENIPLKVKSYQKANSCLTLLADTNQAFDITIGESTPCLAGPQSPTWKDLVFIRIMPTTDAVIESMLSTQVALNYKIPNNQPTGPSVFVSCTKN